MRRRAFSLLEVVLVSVLLLVVLTLGVQILLPVLHSYQKSDRRSGLLQKVAAGLDKIEAEVADSNMRGLQFREQPAALSVQPLGPPGATGKPFWLPELRVFLASKGQLSYHVWRSRKLSQHTVAEPYALVPGELFSIMARPTSGAVLLLSSGLDGFRVQSLEPTVRRLPLQVTLSATLPSGEHFQLSRQISSRVLPSR